MKLKIGNKLQEIRDDRKLNQTEFAELLGISLSAYSRLERGETQADVDQLLRYSEILKVPIQEFLPDTQSFNNNNQNGQSCIVFGTANYTYYNNYGDNVEELVKGNETQKKEIDQLKEKIELLEKQIALLEKLKAA